MGIPKKYQTLLLPSNLFVEKITKFPQTIGGGTYNNAIDLNDWANYYLKDVATEQVNEIIGEVQNSIEELQEQVNDLVQNAVRELVFENAVLPKTIQDVNNPISIELYSNSGSLISRDFYSVTVINGDVTVDSLIPLSATLIIKY